MSWAQWRIVPHTIKDWAVCGPTERVARGARIADEKEPLRTRFARLSRRDPTVTSHFWLVQLGRDVLPAP